MPKDVYTGHKHTLGIILIHPLIHSVLFYFSVSKNFRISPISSIVKSHKVGYMGIYFSSPFLNECKEKHTDIPRYVRLFVIKFPQEDYKLFQGCSFYIMPFYNLGEGVPSIECAFNKSPIWFIFLP